MGSPADRQAARGLEGSAALRGAPRPGLCRRPRALELARWDELPDAQLPWADVAEAAPPSRAISPKPTSIWDLAPGKGQAPPATRARGPARPCRASRVVVVEALAGLAAELAVADHLRPAARRPGGPRRSRRRARRRSRPTTSRPTKSSSRSGPIGWPAPSVMQESTSARTHPGPLHEADGVEEIREQEPVDDEAGLVGHLDRGLAERLAPGDRRGRRRRRAARPGSRARSAPSASPG